MISNRVYEYCNGDITKIENFDKAINDTTQVWHCHHRLETHFGDGTVRPNNARLTAMKLKALDMYYHRPPEELILMTKTEHHKLHSKGNKGCKGHPQSEETKRKISKAQKGRIKSDDECKHISEALKGHSISEETRKKISETLKNGSSWNKGKKTGPISEELRKKLSDSHKGQRKGQHWRIENGKRVWYT